MATPENALSRYGLSTSGEISREDLTDIITNISPTERPLHNNAGRGTAESDLHEWPTDSLADARADNAHVDGEDFQAEGDQTPAAPTGGVFQGVPITAGNRISNYMQIARKDIIVTRRADKIKKTGRRSELTYQIAKAGRELQRDCEMSATANIAAIAGSTTVPARTAGLGAWFRTNTNRGAGATEPTLSGTTHGYPNAAAGAATSLRALSEAAILTTLADIYNEGGDPDMIMMHPTVKQKFSQYMFGSSARIATQFQDHGKSPSAGLTVVGAVDVYVSDFTILSVVPNRFQAPSDVFLLESDMLEIAYFDGYHVEKMGKAGDNERRVLLVDFGLVNRNEAAGGIVSDIDNTAPMVS